jgi:hypothetical protein
MRYGDESKNTRDRTRGRRRDGTRGKARRAARAEQFNAGALDRGTEEWQPAGTVGDRFQEECEEQFEPPAFRVAFRRR